MERVSIPFPYYKKTITRCSIRMRIARSAEHRSENTICTAPVQDCERSENPSNCLNFRHHRYDIYRYHRNRKVGVLNNSPLQPRDISVVSRTKESVTSSYPTTQRHPHLFTLLIVDCQHHGLLFSPTLWTSFQPYILFQWFWTSFQTSLQLQRFPIISHLKILLYLLHTIVSLSEYEVKNHRSPLIIHKPNQYAQHNFASPRRLYKNHPIYN